MAHATLVECLHNARLQGDARYAAGALVRLGHLYLQREDDDAARAAYAESYTLRMRVEQTNRALEAKIGLTEVAHRHDDHATARAELDAVVNHVLTYPLDRTDETLRILACAARLLAAYHDPRAATLESMARDQLQYRAATLADEEQRRVFWSAPDHAAYAPPS